MGKQVRFYMLPDDEKKFLDHILLRPTVKLLRTVSDTTDFVLNSTELTDLRQLPQVYIWDSVYYLDPTNVLGRHRRYFDENLVAFVETEEWYYKLEYSNLPLVVYTRSYIRDDGKLRCGRIWADMYRLETGQLVRREPEFITWYDEMANWLRGYLQRNKELDAYVSLEAMEWHRRGGEFHTN